MARHKNGLTSTVHYTSPSLQRLPRGGHVVPLTPFCPLKPARSEPKPSLVADLLISLQPDHHVEQPKLDAGAGWVVAPGIFGRGGFMTAKRALITGVTGQDGAYLAQLLLQKGYAVTGIVRRSSHAGVFDHRLKWLGILDDVELVDANLLDQSPCCASSRRAKPDEIYNLAAQSFVTSSWQQPLLTGQVTGLGAVHMLECLRSAAPQARYYQASTSEMFGLTPGGRAERVDAFYPRSPTAWPSCTRTG